MGFRTLMIVACVVASGDAACVDFAFAQNFLAGSKQVVTFPVGSPTSMTLVGPQAGTFVGMDFDPSASVLWAVDFASQTVGTVNQATGAYTPTAVLEAPCCVSALTIDPVHGTFYVAKGDALVYTLNPATGGMIPAFQGAATGASISALAMDCTGRMFAVDGRANFGDLYRAFPAGGNPTPVGFPGLVSATSLEFDNQTGSLYGWFNASAMDPSTHVTVDPATAQVSQASVLSGRYRMAIRNMCPDAQLLILSDGFED
jgi:hypothetical protein